MYLIMKTIDNHGRTGRIYKNRASLSIEKTIACSVNIAVVSYSEVAVPNLDDVRSARTLIDYNIKY